MSDSERILKAEAFALDFYAELRAWNASMEIQRSAPEECARTLLGLTARTVYKHINHLSGKDARSVVNEMLYRLKRKLSPSHYPTLDNLYNGIIQECLKNHNAKANETLS